MQLEEDYRAKKGFIRGQSDGKYKFIGDKKRKDRDYKNSRGDLGDKMDTTNDYWSLKE